MNMENDDFKKDPAYIEWRDKIANTVAHTANQIVIKNQEEKKALDKMKSYIFFMQGDCYVDQRKIDFPDKKALYFLLVQALVEHTQIDGSCSYDAIIGFWREHGVEVKEDPKLQVKSIHNAIIQLYKKRKDQRLEFPSTTPNGEKIIEKKKNRIMFNNPITNE